MNKEFFMLIKKVLPTLTDIILQDEKFEHFTQKYFLGYLKPEKFIGWSLLAIRKDFILAIQIVRIICICFHSFLYISIKFYSMAFSVSFLFGEYSAFQKMVDRSMLKLVTLKII